MVQNNVNNHWRLLTLDTKMLGQPTLKLWISKGYSKPWHIFEVFIKALVCTVWTHKNDFKRLALFFNFVVGLYQLRRKASARWALQIKIHVKSLTLLSKLQEKCHMFVWISSLTCTTCFWNTVIYYISKLVCALWLVNLAGHTLLQGPLKFKAVFVAKLLHNLSPNFLNLYTCSK